MPLPSQRITPGRAENAWKQELARLAAREAVAKLWARQSVLWKDDAAQAREIDARLGWLDVPLHMRVGVERLAAFVGEVAASGVRDIVLLGMGGSSLAPEVFSLMFPPAAAGGRFFVLDSTDPVSIRELRAALDLPHALFIVASKSGTTVETRSQFAYFYDELDRAGVRPPGRSFLAITDAGSPLDTLAAERGFRRTFRNPSDIGGRYSALSCFGLVPAALWGVDVGAVLDTAIAMRAACGPDAPADANPALLLGALLSAAAAQGDDKLVLLSTPGLVPLGNWIEQLVAESTGKEGKGIVPVAGGAWPPAEVLARGCVTLAMALAGEDDARLLETVRELERRGAPVVEIRLAAPADVGAEFFRWELATAIAGAALAINPFDEPNVQESKDATRRILSQFESSGRMPAGAPLVADSGVELYAAGETPAAGSLPEVLRPFFAGCRPGDYLALLAFVARNAANGAELDAFRDRLTRRLGLPVLLGYGPRYLHSIGQLYKGGPPSGRFLMITADEQPDVRVPGEKYTFGQLELAQALGDMESLARRGKPVLRLHATRGAAAGWPVLRSAVEQALAALQSAAS